LTDPIGSTGHFRRMLSRAQHPESGIASDAAVGVD